MRKKTVILLSGGLDSAANLAFSHHRAEVDGSPLLALTADYGQRAAPAEIRAAQVFARYYDVPHQVVDLKWLGALGGSALTETSLKLPHLERAQLNERLVTEDSARSVWVPNRNGVLIHVAAAYAERLQAHQVLVGFNVEEAATFPDNSLDYLERVNQALELSTATHIQVFSYTVQWNKNQIVSELKKLPRRFPFETVWSCYEGSFSPCLACESCQRLSRAISELAPEVSSVI